MVEPHSRSGKETMSKVQLIFRMSIDAGQIDAFKDIGARIMDIVRDKGHHTLAYEWFLNEERAEAVVVETFSDSDALLAHAEMIGELGVKLFGLGRIENLWLCGDVSQEVLEKTAGFGPTAYALLQEK
jgi:quinol monooxygenase YgiN